MKKSFLFFFVHPAKYHLFRIVINRLKAEGHDVEIIITCRDILEELIQKEGWNYTKIFPKGRKIKNVHIYLSAGIYLILTVLKLLRLTRGKKYDLFITDDLLTFVGRMRSVPSIFVTDDDLSAVPESSILMATANYVFAPAVCDLGIFNRKKLGYLGYKSLAHLHPNHFTPNPSKIDPMFTGSDRYFFIRTVSATSTHDVGNKGLNDDVVRRLIQVLSPFGKIILNSERELPPDLRNYECDFDKNHVAHYLFYATIFISDSTTMCAEASVLGTPAVEYNDWFANFKQYNELNSQYGLLQGFAPGQENQMIQQIELMLQNPSIKQQHLAKRDEMLRDKVDVSSFLHWLLTDFPTNPKEYLSNPDIQKKFQ